MKSQESEISIVERLGRGVANDRLPCSVQEDPHRAKGPW